MQEPAKPSWRHRLSIAALCAPWLLFFSELFTEYAHNPLYEFALLAPIILGLLVYERARDFAADVAAAPMGTRRKALEATILLGTIFCVPLHLLFEANADWRGVIWAQALLCAALTCALAYRYGGPPMLRRFWPLAVLPLLCVPWPTLFMRAVSGALQEGLTFAAVDITHLLGLSARAMGNLILLGNGTVVGVEEACSGIRSLVGNLFAAGVLGEYFRLRGHARGLLFVLSVIFSLVFNLLRSLLLILTAATSGAALPLLLHDTAGWSVFVLSFAALYGVATFLPRKKTGSTVLTRQAIPPLPLRLSLSVLGLVIAGPLLTPLYYPHEESSGYTLAKPQDARLPASVVTPDAARFRSSLFFSKGESWRWKDTKGLYQLFYFEWASPRLSRLGSASHHPENCLPNVGWEMLDSRSVFLEGQKPAEPSLPGTLSRFKNPAGQFATLLFFRLSPDPTDTRDRMEHADRWQDFLQHKRLPSRSTLQLSLISAEQNDAMETDLLDYARKVIERQR